MNHGNENRGLGGRFDGFGQKLNDEMSKKRSKIADAKPEKTCSVCRERKYVKGGSYKADIFGKRMFICKDCLGESDDE